MMSLLELINHLEKIYNKKIDFSFADWRPGDQPVFVCDISKAKKWFGWKPKVDVEGGVRRLAEWIKDNKKLFFTDFLPETRETKRPLLTKFQKQKNGQDLSCIYKKDNAAQNQ